MNIFRLVLSGDMNLSTKLEILRLKTMTLVRMFSNHLKRNPKFHNGPIKSPDEEFGVYDYKGFKFYYNNDGIRTNSLKSGEWSYDEEITPVITDELSKADCPIFVDIGAHTGFMTLNVLAKIPSVQVFAFEPGQYQSALFEKTIEANKLTDKVTLYKEALGRETGTTSFISQESPDADWSMNNGLLDTGRGLGRQKQTTVHVQTLDNWWKIAGKPEVNVVKMDTEGAELWILQGGTEFLSTCKPTIFLEINPLNLHVYPYGARDILVWLDEHNYYVKTLDGVLVMPDNLKRILKTNEFFVARPKAGLNNER